MPFPGTRLGIWDLSCFLNWMHLGSKPSCDCFILMKCNTALVMLAPFDSIEDSPVLVESPEVPVVEVSALNIYPVKSLRGIQVTEAVIGVTGLAYDRHWMVVDQQGQFVTQRNLAKMALIEVELTDDHLVLKYAGYSALQIPLQVKNVTGQECTVMVWGDECRGIDEGAEASLWLTTVLGQWKGSDLRLVRFADDYTRPVEPDFLQGEQAHTEFPDAYPFLVTNEASLELLNSKLEAKGSVPVTMDRFRANIVLKGLEAFQEDQLAVIEAQESEYNFTIALRKPCQRCKVTSIDQYSGEVIEAKEPLATLVQMKTQPELKGAYFGQNGILLSGEGEIIRVGDKLSYR